MAAVNRRVRKVNQLDRPGNDPYRRQPGAHSKHSRLDHRHCAGCGGRCRHGANRPARLSRHWL